MAWTTPATWFPKSFEVSVASQWNNTVASDTTSAPFWGNTTIYSPTGVTSAAPLPLVASAAALQEWVQTWARDDAEPEPEQDEPMPELPRRRAMALDGVIPAGA